MARYAKVFFLSAFFFCFVFLTASVYAVNAQDKKINKIDAEGVVAGGRQPKVTVNIISPANGQVLSTQNLSPRIDGSYDINLQGISQGSVNIKVKADGFLSRTIFGIDISSNALDNFSVPQLLGGDVNGDGIVDASDATALKGHWRESTEGFDLNGDGVVNSLDFAILKNNLNKISQ